MDEKDPGLLPLVSKIASASIEQQKEGAREFRVLSKTNPDKRIAIANSGAVPLLLQLLFSSDDKVQENAITALLNLSICKKNKSAIVQSPRSLDAFLHALLSGLTVETRENAAALLFSLMVAEEYRPLIGQKAGVIAALLDLLRSESRRAQKDALRALFHIALCAENRPYLVAKDAVPALFSVLSNSSLGEDVLAVLAQIARCPESVDIFLKLSAVPVLVEKLDTGTSREKENAASALLNLCQSGGTRPIEEVLERSCTTSLSMLMTSGSPRGKGKASALLQLLVLCQDR